MHFVMQVSAVEGLPLIFVEPDSSAAVASVQVEVGAVADLSAREEVAALGTEFAGGRIVAGQLCDFGSG